MPLALLVWRTCIETGSGLQQGTGDTYTPIPVFIRTIVFFGKQIIFLHRVKGAVVRQRGSVVRLLFFAYPTDCAGLVAPESIPADILQTVKSRTSRLPSPYCRKPFQHHDTETDLGVPSCRQGKLRGLSPSPRSRTPTASERLFQLQLAR